ncbi:MAG: fused MFS/spermidine synthase, partial [Bacteroidales bacterium]|nr:fused MFS/spermidine synthase [Bacteroidales bacterium]
MVTMIYEIAGARAIGPYFGTSILIWTSMIGIIMGSLSLGYWMGGWISKHKSDIISLAWILLLASVFIFFTAISNKFVLDRVIKYIPGIRLQTVLSVITLFSPGSILLGMVLPIGIKIKIGNLSTSGNVVGKLYALSSVGSIIGTFITGYLLLPMFGFGNVIFAISLLMVLASLTALGIQSRYKIALIPLMASIIFSLTWNIINSRSLKYIDTDTRYNRVIIYHTTDQQTGRPVKILKVNDEKSSAMFTDRDDDLVFEVLRYYKLINHFTPNFRNTLMIGGSGYAFPKFYLQNYPYAKIDVVEIDPGLTEIAREYFNLNPNERLGVFHEDGRTFLNR